MGAPASVALFQGQIETVFGEDLSAAGSILSWENDSLLESSML